MSPTNQLIREAVIYQLKKYDFIDDPTARAMAIAIAADVKRIVDPSPFSVDWKTDATGVNAGDGT